MTEWASLSSLLGRSSEEGIPDNHVVTVTERSLSVDIPELIQNNIKTDTVTLELDAEWDGISPVIIFECSDADYQVQYEGAATHIPQAVMKNTGSVGLSVCGYDDTGEIRLVTKAAPSTFTVVASGSFIGEISEDDVSLLGQILAAAKAANEAAHEVATASFSMGTITTLEPGEQGSASLDGEGLQKTLNLSIPKGAKGDKGDPGEKGDPGADGTNGQNGADGFSPTVEVSKSGTVTTISITDKTGPKTAQINDGVKGDKGDPGHTPKRGVDYWTDEDRKPVEDATAAANAAAEKAENATEVTTYSRIPISFEGSEPGLYVNNNGKWARVDAEEFPEFKASRPVGISGITGNIIIDTGDESKFNQYISVCAFFATENVVDAKPVSFVPYTRGGVYSVEVPPNAKYVVFDNNVTADGNKIADISARAGRSNVESFAEVAGLVESGGNLDNANYINLPERYRLVVGDKFELFWKGVIQAADPYSYNIRARCDSGSCYRRKYEFTPTSAGEHTLTVSVENDVGRVLDSASVILEVNEKASSPSSNVNVLCVGDSLTAPGQWPYESNRRLTGSGGTPTGDGLSNVTYIGTCEKSGVKFEGYGGWTFDSYNGENKSDSYSWITCSHSKTGEDQHSTYSDTNGVVWKIETIEASRLKMIRVSGSTPMPESGTLTYVSGGVDHSDITFTSSETAAGNPFWNEAEGSVDFAEYARKVGASSIDYCYVLLGWNDTGKSDEQLKSAASTFIENLSASFPNCKIALMGLEVPSLDGFGVNYGCSWNYMDKLRTVFRFNRVYESLADEYENVHFVNIAGQFDTENNMRESTRAVNARNSKTETYQTNGVHPETSGYNQIADAVYRDLTGMIVE